MLMERITEFKLSVYELIILYKKKLAKLGKGPELSPTVMVG